jgi:carbon monoxide dehydrogenase subunit G
MAIGPLRSERSSAPPGRGVRHVERRAYVNAPPRIVWATLGDPANVARLFPELTLGPAEPAWPAASACRRGRVRIGLLRSDATLESLEARPASIFRLRITAATFGEEWCWRLEPRAGGTRVVHAATFQTGDRMASLLVRLGRDSVADRVEAHLRAVKEIAEADWARGQQRQRESRLA